MQLHHCHWFSIVVQADLEFGEEGLGEVYEGRFIETKLVIDEVKDGLWTVVLVCRNVCHLSAIDRDVVEDQGWRMNVEQSNRPSARYVTSFLRDRVRLVSLIYHFLLSPCFSSNQMARPQISPSGLLEILHRYSELVRGFSHALSQQVPSESGFKLAPLKV